VARCPHCDISLTRHLNRKLVCHYCGYEIPEYETCPACGSPHIGGISVGTEQVEEQLKKEFPGIRTLRMDLDTTRGKEGHGKILKEFGERKADVLIGTQMIVKGHDFPNVTLVGVLLADLSLNAQDYRAAERTFQLITQAAGRAGRGQKPGTAVIQTYKPDHFAILTAAAQNYEAFYKEEMAYRRIMHYPPEGLLLAVLGSGEDPAKLHEAMEYIRRFISRIDPKNAFSAIGPAPQTVGKVRDRYREVIYIRHREREMLVKARSLIERYTEMNSGFADIRVEFNLST
jgi:primosomal protein N' (replication factor Y)